jgi:hypothetical protein
VSKFTRGKLESNGENKASSGLTSSTLIRVEDFNASSHDTNTQTLLIPRALDFHQARRTVAATNVKRSMLSTSVDAKPAKQVNDDLSSPKFGLTKQSKESVNNANSEFISHT